MNQSGIHLLDLPDEMLLSILKKFDNVDVLYSFLGINNERLDSLTREKTFSSILSFTSTMANNTGGIDRFCNNIFPRIHSNVKCLTVEAASMERILLAADYLNLTELKLWNFQRDSSLDYLTNDSSLRNIFKQRIRKLHLINKDRERGIGSLRDYTKRVYAHFLTLFENLEHFNVIETSNPSYPGLSIRYFPSNTFSSLILPYLSINVSTWTDCLYLLDGRLKQLSTFIVQIHSTKMNSS